MLKNQVKMASSIYNFVCKSIRGKEVELSQYRGNVCLIVNVASEWGLTKSNYSQLQTLYERHQAEGFSILGFPCNQFGKQEPKSNEEIEQFAREKFNTTWDLFAKIEVNGDNADPLYKFLKGHKNGKGFMTNAIKWNFSKFLISREGDVVKRYGPKEDPFSIEKDIVKELTKKGTQM